MMCKMRPSAGFSFLELLIALAIILVIAGIAIPFYQKSVTGAKETAAIETLQNIGKMQVQYFSSYGRFARSLTELGPPPAGKAPGGEAAALLPPDLALGRKGGYMYSVFPTATGYAVTAVPEAFGSTGSRTFYSDETMVLRHNSTAEPATASSPILP